MPEATVKEPVFRKDREQAKPNDAEQNRAREGGEPAKPREGIVVSTVMRLTTSDGNTFEEAAKAMEHEAFYQILKRLVKDLGWQDNEETGVFATNLAKHYRTLLPVLSQLEKDAETLQSHLARYQRAL